MMAFIAMLSLGAVALAILCTDLALQIMAKQARERQLQKALGRYLDD